MYALICTNDVVNGGTIIFEDIVVFN